LLGVGAEILIVGFPLPAENYCDSLLVLHSVERGYLALPLHVEWDCLVVLLRAALRYSDLVIMLPAEEFRDGVE
jgi:hypothetical protein